MTMVQVAFRRGIAVGVAAFALATSSAMAQEHAHGGHAKADSAAPAASHAMHSSGWAELDEFHMVMMATWHPAKQKNDLAPIRARAADMAAAAEKWEKAAAPEKCADAETRKTVAKVAAESRALASLVERNGSDEEVKASLAALHDTFESVEHGCAAAH
jgi:hypothetical protein